MLPPEKELLGAHEEVVLKQEQLEVAQTKANRAKQLLASRAISEKVFEEAQVELTRARAALKAATARLNLLSSTDLDGAAGNLSTLVLESPEDSLIVPSSVLYFEEGTDIMQARQLVQERLTQLAERLPAVAKPLPRRCPYQGR